MRGGGLEYCNIPHVRYTFSRSFGFVFWSTLLNILASLLWQQSVFHIAGLLPSSSSQTFTRMFYSRFYGISS